MASYEEILRQYAGNVLTPAQQAPKPKPQPRISDDTFYRIAAARANGTGSSITDPIERDLIDLNAQDLIAKYGPQADAWISQRAMASNRFANDRYDPTGGGLGDMAIAAGSGFVNSLGSIGALGAGLVSDDAGAYVSSKMKDFTDWTASKQSSGLNAHRRANATINDLTSSDNAARYEQERKTSGSLVAGLRRIGRDVLDSVSSAVDDPTIMADGVGQGIGSLLAGGALGKAAKAVGVAQRFAMPGAIGLQEGAGAYTQTVNEALAQGASNGQAGDAGLTAAMIQAPLGVVTGKMVSKFEANPFKVPSIGSAAGNLIREAAEEGIQSASGQLAQNQGIRSFVNPDQDMLEGVGEQAGLGALYGAGTAGVVQTPGAALRASVDAAKLTGRAALAGAKGIGNAILARGERIQSANDQASSERIAEAQKAAVSALADPEFTGTIEQDVLHSSESKEAKMAALTALGQLSKVAQVDPAEAEDQSEKVAQAIGSSADKFDVLRNVSKIVSDKESSEQDKLDAGLYLHKAINDWGSGLLDTVNQVIGGVKEDSPGHKQLQDLEDVFFNIVQDPLIRKAMDTAVNGGVINPETVAQVGTPEGDKAVQQAIEVAQFAPDKANPEVNDLVLRHATEGKIGLTQEQRGALAASSSLVREGQAYEQQISKLGLTNSDIVSKQIQADENNKDSPGLSANEHFRGITQAMRVGKVDDARELLEDFMSFAQSMNNKVAALQQSFESGKGKEGAVPYQAVNPRTRKFYKAAGVWLDPKGYGSVRTAQQMAADTQAVTNLANNLARIFPELGVSEIKAASLDPAILEGPAKEVVRRFRKGEMKAQSPLVQTQVEEETGASEANAGRRETAPEKEPVVDREPEAKPVDDQREELKSVSADDVLDRMTTKHSVKGFIEELQNKPRKQVAAIIDVNGAVREITGKSDIDLDPNAGDHAALGAELFEAGHEDATEFQAQLTRYGDQLGIGAYYPDKLNTRQLATIRALLAQGKRAGLSVITDGRIDKYLQQEDTAPAREEVSVPQATETDETGAAQEQVEEPAPEEPKSKLVKTSKFNDAYKQPSEPISRMAEMENPVADVANRIQDKATVKGNAASAVRRDYGKYLDLARPIYKAMMASLGKQLGKTYYDTTFREALLEGIEGKHPVTSLRNGRALNIVEVYADGKMSYNQQLVQSAILAGLQWLNTQDQRNRTLKDEEIAKILGVEEDEISETERNFFNNGTWSTAAVRDLASSIRKFWGVKPNNAEAKGYVEGIVQGVAAEVLLGMSEAGLIAFEKENFEGKTFESIVLPETSPVIKMAEGLQADPTLIEKQMLIEPGEAHYIGEAPAKVPQYQLRSPAVPLTKQQKDAVTNRQNVPHYINRTNLDFMRALGRDGVAFLFGKGDHRAKHLNVNHAKSLKGVNDMFANAFDAIEALTANMAHVSEDTEIDEMPIFYAREITSVGRMMQVGRYTPQSNKLVREVVMPTWDTLDLTNQGHRNNFFLALAQHLDEKVHKQSLETSIKNVEGKLEELDQVVTLLREWVSLQDTKTPMILADEDIMLIKDQLTKVVGAASPVAVHSLIEYARYREADEAVRKAFRTSLYLEADGVTDGPINAIMNLTSGEFSPEFFDRMERGGLSLRENASANDFFSSDKGDSRDLYELSTDNLKRAGGPLQRLWNFVKDDFKLNRQNDALKVVMSELLKDVTINPDGTVTFKRGIAKNPLTVKIYGSSTKGIAAKIAKQMIDTYYERLSEPASLSPEFRKAFDTLLDNSVREFEGKTYVKNEPGKPTGSGTTLTLDKTSIENLRSNVLHLFAAPLNEAIEETVGPAIKNAELVRKATQAQAIHMKYAFKQRIDDELKNREGKPSDFLSQDELNTILEDLKKSYPLINTGTQLIFVAGSQRSDIDTQEFGSSLADKLRTDAFVYGPDNPGVAGIPYLVIATGDGQMMLNVSTMENAPEGTLDVYDGLNIKISTIAEDSRKVNEAVYQGWQQNPMRGVSDAFSGFLKATKADQGENSAFNEEMREELAKVFFRPSVALEITAEQLGKVLAKTAKTLDTKATSIDARKAAMAQVNLSVDHMASAAAPFVKSDGVALPYGDPQAMLFEMNKLYEAELAKRSGAKKDEQAEPSEDLSEALSFLGSKDEATGVRTISRDELRLAVKSLNIPAEQKMLLRDAVNALDTKGYRIVFGSNAAIAAYANDPELDDGMMMGEIRPQEKVIYIADPTSETLTHEFIHAATIEKLVAYYHDPKLVSEAEGEAIKRIELLMSEFLEINPYSVKDEETQKAYASAYFAITGNLTNKVVAINEFMAWVLSNQKLAQLAAQTKVQNPLARIVSEVLAKLKKLWSKGVAPSVADDLFTNLRFNTAVLMRSKTGIREQMQGLVLHQSTQFGTDQRLTDIRAAMNDKVISLLKNADPIDRPEVSERLARAGAMAGEMAGKFQARGFLRTMQEAGTFQSLVHVFATEAFLDPNAAARIQDLYSHVTKTLKVEDFMADPDSLDEGDRYQAQRKFDAVMGVGVTDRDALGRSTLMSAFLALANVDPQFRGILANMKVPGAKKGEDRSVDQALTDFGTEAMNNLARWISGDHKAGNISQAIDMLTRRLAANADNEQAFVDQYVTPVGNAVDKANENLVKAVEKLATKGFDKMDELQAKSKNKAVRGALEIGKYIAAAATEDRGAYVADSVVSTLNQMKLWRPLTDLIRDMAGRTSDNQLYDLIKLFRTESQQTRQQFREQVPEIIAKKFTRRLTDQEWSHLFKGLARTDLAALERGRSTAQVMALLQDPSRLSGEISGLEETIKASAGADWQLHLKKAQELAVFMNTGKVPGNLLRNAEAIAHLHGEAVREAVKVTPALIEQIDQLVTLYAVDGLDARTKEAVSSLAQSQIEGMSFTYDYLRGQRKGELGKVAQSDRARINHFKGYVHTESQSGLSLIVADNAQEAELLSRGYVRLGAYDGSRSEPGKVARSYFFSPVSGKAMYNQGLVQTVRQTAYGVDPVTGFTIGLQTAGRITDRKSVARITQLHALNNKATEPLMPIYDSKGDVVAYERSMDPKHQSLLQADQHLAKVIGQWRGRQVEEYKALHLNKQLVEVLADMWETAEEKSGEFVNILDPKVLKADPILADAVALFTPEMKDHIRDVFGKDTFMVRKDLIDDTIGYRSASVSDAWTGNTRWAPEVQRVTRTLAMSVFGNDAYRYFVRAEQFYKDRIADAKLIIVVKSIVVPVSNLVSNVYQLASNGVPIKDIVTKMPKKTAEVDAYIRGHLRKIELEAELRAAGNDLTKARRIKAEVHSIDDAAKRLSIWPLIERGEFSSISEGLTSEDLMLAEGRLKDYMEKLVDRLPEGVKTAGRYAIVGRDTALFKGLQRATEYGDFLAKAILYEDLMKRQKLNQEEALQYVSDEFINYDRLPGRFMTYADQMGLAWFWKFKVRSVKVAARALKRNPLHVLLAGLAPTPNFVGSVGLPVEDNFLVLTAEGKLDNSIGPGTGFRSMGLNPWVNLFG